VNFLNLTTEPIIKAFVPAGADPCRDEAKIIDPAKVNSLWEMVLFRAK